MSKNISLKVLDAIEKAPNGITTLRMLESLNLCDANTLKTTLSRLNKAGRIIRLKRGTYSSRPMKDAFAVGQELFRGYLGFSSALYLHKMITEVPFRITVITTDLSKTKTVEGYEFKAVALHEKAVGFERLGAYVVSTRAKTLFDCAYLPDYSVEEEKLIAAFKEARLSEAEWKEFDIYVQKFMKGKDERFARMKKMIRG